MKYFVVILVFALVGFASAAWDATNQGKFKTAFEKLQTDLGFTDTEYASDITTAQKKSSVSTAGAAMKTKITEALKWNIPADLASDSAFTAYITTLEGNIDNIKEADEEITSTAIEPLASLVKSWASLIDGNAKGKASDAAPTFKLGLEANKKLIALSLKVADKTFDDDCWDRRTQIIIKLKEQKIYEETAKIDELVDALAADQVSTVPGAVDFKTFFDKDTLFNKFRKDKFTAFIDAYVKTSADYTTELATFGTEFAKGLFLEYVLEDATGGDKIRTEIEKNKG